MEPSAESSNKEGHKYPFVSHEILKSQSSIILDHFFPSISSRPRGSSVNSSQSEDGNNAAPASPRSNGSGRSQVLIIDENSYHKENLDYLFGILTKKEEVNCVLLGYFAKVVSSFFQKNKKEICSYFYSNDQHLANFLHHLYSKSLVDPLKNFLVIYPEDHYHHEDIDSRDKSRASHFSKFYDKRVKAFQSLYTLLDKAEDFETISNAQYIIETLVAKIDQTVDGQKLLDDVVLRKENVKAVFSCLKSTNRYKRKAAAEILNLTFSLLLNEVVEEPEKRNTMMAATTQANPEFSKYYEQKRRDEKNSLFQTFVDELESIVAGLRHRTDTPRTFNNTIGREVKIIDTADIRILQLVQGALKFNLENLNIIISSGDFFDTLFALFKNSGWNSSVHTIFSDLIKTCLNANRSPTILKKLAENNRLVKLLNDCIAKGACFVDDRKVFRKAYCGAVNEIGTVLSRLGGENKALFCNNDLWKSFYDEYLKPIIDVERSDRDDVFRKSSKFDRPDFGSNIPFELFTALANLQMDRNANNHIHEETPADAIEGNDGDENAEGTEETAEEVNLPEVLVASVGDDVKVEDSTSEDQASSSDHNPPAKEQLTLPREVDMVLKHQKSIEEQIITTNQDEDLIKENQEVKAEESVEDVAIEKPALETAENIKLSEISPEGSKLVEEQKDKPQVQAEEDDTKLDANIR